MGKKRKPVDMSVYPENWDEISKAIRQRAGNQCEWCGIPNYSLIHRGITDKFMWILDEDWQRLSLADRMLWDGNESKIFLTVAHLNHTPSDCRPENLAALCNRCHLNYDAKFHAQNARHTRAKNARQAAEEHGQLEMWQKR